MSSKMAQQTGRMWKRNKRGRGARFSLRVCGQNFASPNFGRHFFRVAKKYCFTTWGIAGGAQYGAVCVPKYTHNLWKCYFFVKLEQLPKIIAIYNYEIFHWQRQFCVVPAAEQLKIFMPLRDRAKPASIFAGTTSRFAVFPICRVLMFFWPPEGKKRYNKHFWGSVCM